VWAKSKLSGNPRARRSRLADKVSSSRSDAVEQVSLVSRLRQHGEGHRTRLVRMAGAFLQALRCQLLNEQRTARQRREGFSSRSDSIAAQSVDP